jgi:hypothetical protein
MEALFLRFASVAHSGCWKNYKIMQPIYTTFGNDPTQKAFENVRRTIDSSRRFPDSVFQGKWETFLFFDGDRMFDPNFVDCVNKILHLESGVCACMANLDTLVFEHADESSTFFIDQRVTPEKFSAKLSSPSAGEGWIFGVDRFGCASDAGHWSIYCEKRNEIAVIAGGRGVPLKSCVAVTEGLRALPIEQAIERGLSYGFSARALSPEWRDMLIRNYSDR